MHEASRRLLSVLLRCIDGFLSSEKVIVVGATNRVMDIDRLSPSPLPLTPVVDKNLAPKSKTSNHLLRLIFLVSLCLGRHSALRSRFDLSVRFALPDDAQRAAIFALYTRHLSQSDRNKLASIAEVSSHATKISLNLLSLTIFLLEIFQNVWWLRRAQHTTTTRARLQHDLA